MKICPNCRDEKPYNEFSKNNSRNDGYSVYCRSCCSIRYQERYKEKHTATARKYQKENRDKILAKKREYTANNREDKSNYDKTYRELNAKNIADYKRDWEKDQLVNNPVFKIKRNLRRRLSHALAGKTKSAPTMELLGCSPEELKLKLEDQFTGDMSWENYGSLFHIDHIKPCDAFDLTKEEEQRACFHYSNLQPLLVIDNQKKGSKWDG